MINSVDLERPGTWHPYKNGLCNDCVANCCRLPVEVKIPDLIRMNIIDEFEAEEPLKKISKRLKKEGIVQHLNIKNEIFTLSQRPNLDCIFLDQKTRKCTIYEKRPETCRNHPKIGPRPGYCAYQKI